MVRPTHCNSESTTAKMVVSCCFVLLMIANCAQGSKPNLVHEMEDGQKYSLIKAPPANSEIVQKAMKDISLTLDLEDIAEDFNIIARYLQIAYNGLVVRPKLQGEVKDLQIKALILSDKSTVAFNDFARASSKVLSLLESTYFFLYKGKLKIAQETFASVSDKANEMAAKAKSLKEEYEHELNRTRNLLGRAHDEQDGELNKRNQALKDKREMETKLRRLEEAKNGALEKFKVLEGFFYDARRKEHRAIRDQANPWKKLANGLAKSFIGVEVYDMGVYKDAAEGYRKAKDKYFEEMEKVRDIKNKHKADIAEFAKRVKNSQTESELSDIAIEALKDVVFGLTQVATIMQNAANYWDEMHHVINDMKESKFLELAMKDFSLEERNEVLYSDFFQEEILQNYAKWTATKVICSSFFQRIKPARKTLQEVIVERPLNEKESLARARQVASELESNIRKIEYKKDEL